MRRFLLIVCLSIFTCSAFAYSSYPEGDVTWIDDDNAFVTTHPNSFAYEMLGKPVFYSWRVSVNNKFRERETISYLNYTQKRIKKSTIFKVRGYCNLETQLSYDTYVIEIKDVMYLLPAKYVVDNKILNDVNNELSERYETLKRTRDNYVKERADLRARTVRESEDSLRYYQHLKNTLPPIVDSIEATVRADYRRMEKEEIDEWINSLPSSTKRIYNNVLSLSRASLHSQNSAGGCDCSVYYTNKSKKTIKYLSWTGTFYNAVNDRVYCDIRSSSSFTGKDTGPVGPGEDGGGVWDCVIYNWSAEYVTLTDIFIIYMDGSTISIGASDIKRLLTEPEMGWGQSRAAQKYGGSEKYAIEKALKPYKPKLDRCDDQIKKWEDRLKLMYEGEFYIPKGSPWDEAFSNRIKAINSLYSDIYRAEEAIENFEKKNLITNSYLNH